MAGIIATIWPATDTKEKLIALHQNWVRILRLNCSHATHEWMEKLFSTARKVEKELSNTFAFFLDIKGPGIRTGDLEKPVTYEKGEKFKIVVDQKLVDNPKTMFIDYSHLLKDIYVGAIMRLDSGVFSIKVVEKNKDHIVGQAMNKFTVISRRHINLPWLKIKLPGITEKDKEDILFGIKHNISYVSLSFARSAKDLAELREFLYKNQSAHVKIIAKIESQEWLDNLSEIIRAADAVMVARWDLWAEVPIETIPSHQLNIVGKVKRKWKKVIVATQMLETMMDNCIPTRAEVTDVFYAVLQWADYLMLSGETSAGKYPIETVEVMNRIIAEGKKFI